MMLLNVFPVIGTDPKDLKQLSIDSKLGYKNQEQADAIKEVIGGAKEVVCAWGTPIDEVKNKLVINEAVCLVLSGCLNNNKPNVLTLTCDVTKNGHPRHPLYVSKQAVFNTISAATLLATYQ